MVNSSETCPMCAKAYGELETLFKHPVNDPAHFIVLAPVTCQTCQTTYLPLQIVANKWFGTPGFHASYTLGTVTRDAKLTSAYRSPKGLVAMQPILATPLLGVPIVMIEDRRANKSAPELAELDQQLELKLTEEQASIVDLVAQPWFKEYTAALQTMQAGQTIGIPVCSDENWQADLRYWSVAAESLGWMPVQEQYLLDGEQFCFSPDIHFAGVFETSIRDVGNDKYACLTLLRQPV